MSDGNHLTLSVGQERELNRICDQFELELQKGASPRIEEILATSRFSSSSRLFLELVHMEVEYRRKKGEEPREESYLRRFPQYAVDIRKIFSQGDTLTSASGATNTSQSDQAPTADFHDTTSEQDSLSRAQIAPGVKSGQYIFRECIGSGGMGEVWRATQLGTEREVAIKIVNSSASERDNSRFAREVRLASRLEHPNIARIYESGSVGGVDYYVMEYVDGFSLANAERLKSLSDRDIAELMVAVSEAVEYAHSVNIVHRDLKPANIMMREDGSPRLVDFGLARCLVDSANSSQFTKDGDVLGTPAYMSPEQAAGRHDQVDIRTDIYALGAILYYLLTCGTAPFRGTPAGVVHQVLHSHPPSPRALGATSRDLDAICVKAMCKEPSGRYQTVAELIQDLRNFLDGSPVKARALGPLSSGLRWCRHPSRVYQIATGAMIFGMAMGFFHIAVLIIAIADGLTEIIGWLGLPRPVSPVKLSIAMVLYMALADIPVTVGGIMILRGRHIAPAIAALTFIALAFTTFAIVVYVWPDLYPLSGVHRNHDEIRNRWQVFGLMSMFFTVVSAIAVYSYWSNRKLFGWRETA